MDLLCSNLTAETGLIPVGAPAQAANCDGFITPDSRSPLAPALETVESESTLRGSAEGLEGDYVALLPRETCLSHVTGRGLLASSHSL